MKPRIKPWLFVLLLIGGFLLFLYAMSFIGQRIPN